MTYCMEAIRWIWAKAERISKLDLEDQKRLSEIADVFLRRKR